MIDTTRRVTVIVQPDGAVEGRTFRLPYWLLQVGVVTGIAMAAFLLFAVLAYAPLARAAAKAVLLDRKVERLEAENGRIRELAAALDSLQARYEQVRGMVGADVVPALAQVAAPLMVAPTVRAAAPGGVSYPAGASAPRFWPLDDPGYPTRGLSSAEGEPHEGLDIAVATGSPVRAAGGGTVVDAGEDPVFGYFVLIGHPDDYQTLYGHLSRIVAVKGRSVDPGEVIGLAGNTGRSSAPHLHFEIRRKGEAVDPTTLVKQEG